MKHVFMMLIGLIVASGIPAILLFSDPSIGATVILAVLCPFTTVFGCFVFLISFLEALDD